MKPDSEMHVQYALQSRGIELSKRELEKVDANFRRLKTIYASIPDWIPPAGTGGRELSAGDTVDRSGACRAVAAVEHSLSQIEALNQEINAFTAVTSGRARAQASVLDNEADDTMPLAGLSFGAKNLFDVKGEVTAAGSIINLDEPPAAQDASAVRFLTEAGAVLVGMTNMDEYAYGFTTENHHYGSVRNPHDRSRTAGGSSGGSAAAVAADMVPLAIGTDTNGSIRVPAACCGIFGLKPTFGRVSVEGSFPFVDSLDHVGLFAARSKDLVTAGAVLLQTEASAIEAAFERFKGTERADGGIRVGILGGYFDCYMDDTVRAAFADFTRNFTDAEYVNFPSAADVRAAAFLLTAREGGERHKARLKERYADFDPKNCDRLAAGLLVEDEWLTKARDVLAWAREQAQSLFKEVDILLAPAIPCLPPLLGQETIVLGGEEMPTRASLGLFTQPLTPMGVPIVSAPLSGVRGLPVGAQIIARHDADEMLLGFVAHLEARGLLQPFGREATA